MTKISDIGEFGFIDAIKEDTLYHKENVVVGIGDDGAVYTTTPGWQQVAVIDTMVQNSHFIIGQTATWHDVGFKAVASNLSDIAAMGAVPTHIVLSTALAPQMDVDDVIEMYRGIKDICRAYEVNILGGDTVMSKEGVVLTVAAFGEIEAGKALLRSGAQAGDVIAVSHTIGDSAGGLDVLLAGRDGYEHLKKAHQYPEPQIALGRLLVQHHCHSLNDISDGLASESNEIAKASGVELVIDRNQVPTSHELKAWAAASGKDIWKFVFNGGEDYELVFTMAPDDFQALQAVYPAVTPIGTVRQGPGRVLLRHDGGEQVLPPTGWTHF
ncbi:thiamine-phosphate kinase [uncultured Megasphaera sp.]|uniref:thiamine-phosphate kinase n=1 Tax=uncultured Megasphaera sp. TaxID=165188 RepID=UPI0026380E4D|nr:thiamine-phosphate kinase [uncultured Megasphaera sp.]